MGCCCPGGCPCPDSGAPKCQTGGRWTRGKCIKNPSALTPEQPCCYCDDNCDDPNLPHKAWAPYNTGCGSFENKCDCECDPQIGGQIGEWTYTYAPLLDAEGNPTGQDDQSKPTSRTWDGDCPEHIPDFVNCNCECTYKVDPSTCPNYPDKKPSGNAQKCECECVLTNDICQDRDPTTPVADTSSCRCVCDKPPCPPSEPEFDSSNCSCYCPHIRNNDCPADKPEVNGQCECYCPISSCDPGFQLVDCECVPCSNSCEGCQTQNADCSCSGCTDCDFVEQCYLDETDTEVCICCPPGAVACGGICTGSSCPVGQQFSYDTCQCECKGSKELCRGKCYDPCGEGETRDSGDCSCYDASASSLLNMVKHLLP